jgi:hypothetical protein
MNVTEAIAPAVATPRSVPPGAPPVPLSARKVDIAILAFYWLNLLVITYIVDVEQLTIPDMHGAWTYPAWPPKPAVDLIHWYGTSFDPVLIARPVWWKMTIWLDSLVFGPYYAFAIYAFTKGKDWIRIPSIIQSSLLIAVVVIILGEETAGEHATPHLAFVYALNAPWLLMPMLVIARMYRAERPFAKTAITEAT